MSRCTRAFSPRRYNRIWTNRFGRTRLFLQSLEDRSVPATITVTNNLDVVALDGSVSIREAINSINGGASVNADVVPVGAYGVGDTVIFIAGLASPISLTALAGNQLSITKSMSINGPGTDVLTIANT